MDGIYTADPVKDPSATRYDRISYTEALSKRLQVMDAAAFSLCQDNHVPIIVFDMNQPGNIQRAVLGETQARVAVEAAVQMSWDRYLGLSGRFVGMHGFGESGKIADVYKKFDITAEAVVRAARDSLRAVSS